MPFEELKGLLSEEDYKKSVDEWERQTKNKKWYHMTMDAFINFMYQVRWNSVYRIRNFICPTGCWDLFVYDSESCLVNIFNSAKSQEHKTRQSECTGTRWCQGVERWEKGIRKTLSPSRKRQ